MNELTLGNPLQYVSTRLVREPTFSSRPILKSPIEVANFLKQRVDLDMDREVFGTICFSPAMQVNHAEITSIGVLDCTLLTMREIYKTAVTSSSGAIVIWHTHPTTGLVKPSHDDYGSTLKAIEAGRILSIKLLDHIILSGDGSWISMNQMAQEENMDLEEFCKHKWR